MTGSGISYSFNVHVVPTSMTTPCQVHCLNSLIQRRCRVRLLIINNYGNLKSVTTLFSHSLTILQRPEIFGSPVRRLPFLCFFPRHHLLLSLLRCRHPHSLENPSTPASILTDALGFTTHGAQISFHRHHTPSLNVGYLPRTTFAYRAITVCADDVKSTLPPTPSLAVCGSLARCAWSASSHSHMNSIWDGVRGSTPSGHSVTPSLSRPVQLWELSDGCAAASGYGALLLELYYELCYGDGGRGGAGAGGGHIYLVRKNPNASNSK